MAYYTYKDITNLKIFNISSHRWYIYLEHITKKDKNLCNHFAIKYEWYHHFMIKFGGFVANNDGEVYFKNKLTAGIALIEFKNILRKILNDDKLEEMMDELENGESNIKFTIDVVSTNGFKYNCNRFVLACLDFEVQDYHWAELINMSVDDYRKFLIVNYKAKKIVDELSSDIYWDTKEEALKAREWLISQIVAGRLQGSKDCRWYSV
jgi:hypothetical protein